MGMGVVNQVRYPLKHGNKSVLTSIRTVTLMADSTTSNNYLLYKGSEE